MRYALVLVFFGITAMLGFSYAEETEKSTPAETQPTIVKETSEQPAVGPVVGPKANPAEDYVASSRKVWKDYRAALRKAKENLVQSLELAEADLQDKLKNLRLDAREAVKNARVKDACEVGRLKWRENLALSGEALGDFCKANRAAWENYVKARSAARTERNSALEANRSALKNSQ